ncbi:MAG: methyltransferase domain-containing protein [Thomasclavelia ramosa]
MLGCGPGIYAELFYQYGYQVTGIDIIKTVNQLCSGFRQTKGFDIITFVVTIPNRTLDSTMI